MQNNTSHPQQYNHQSLSILRRLTKLIPTIVVSLHPRFLARIVFTKWYRCMPFLFGMLAVEISIRETSDLFHVPV